MSQVIFDTELDGRKVQVVGGWDRPMNGYHLTIYDISDDEERILYCNMDDRELVDNMGFPPTNQRYKDVCEEMGIELPDHFWEACDAKLGNIRLRYNPQTDMWESR